MKVSVALATYNGEKYILEQLRSILEQTRQVDEVVITDDCSRDRTVEYVREFIATNKLVNWHLYENESNLGYGANFFKAVDLCSGDIIFLSDQDDVWTKNRAEVMTRIMDEHSEIGLLNTARRPLEEATNINEFFDFQEKDLSRILLNKNNCFLQYPGCAMCFRKSLYLKYKKYTEANWAHDTFIWSFALLDGCCFKTSFVSLLRRTHAGQTSGKLSHSFQKRVRFLSHQRENYASLLECAVECKKSNNCIRLYRRIETMFRYRLELVRDRKIFRLFKLFFYLDCYRSKKSYFREIMIALRG